MTVNGVVNLAREERRAADLRIFIPDENAWKPMRSVSIHMQMRDPGLTDCFLSNPHRADQIDRCFQCDSLGTKFFKRTGVCMCVCYMFDFI